MSLTVLVPDRRGIDRLTGVDGVRPELYEPGGPVPPVAAEAEVLVLPQGPAAPIVPLLRSLPRLRLAQTLSAGYDQWLPYLPDGVALSNARGAHGGATAEWAAAVLLSVFRGLPGFATAQTAQRWAPRVTDGLDGRRILVLGAGDLARELHRRLEPFGARTTLVGRTARDGVRAMDDVPVLLPAQDAVVVMLPLTEETDGIVDAAFLARMADGAVLVNAGRGPLVRTGDLLAELRAGRLHAALDVTDPEPLPPDHPLWSAPNVLITPHVGGATTGFLDRAWAVVAEQVAAFAAGRRPPNLVT